MFYDCLNKEINEGDRIAFAAYFKGDASTWYSTVLQIRIGIVKTREMDEIIVETDASNSPNGISKKQRFTDRDSRRILKIGDRGEI